ncbi:MAG TPA: undecaprenyldiphospho-muramoylpentapeptide beta-N-acetylglucosaminyltransferase [Vicinamibacterales bacterium]|nr:undecaprenyldiphospho-muramoylpentapeptide beta-N-acetylglucosaminyltransferase [Vicinamibacterales bacterium]
MSVSLLIAGGGTGGHLFPGVAVARELMARMPGAAVTFVGTAAGIEARVIPREGLTLDTIRSAGLKGKSPVALLRGLLLLPLSAWDAWRVISRRRPSVVIGVGGYSSGPVVALAALRGVPTLLMEQNATPGLTNRLLSRLVRAAAVTYEESLATFGRKAFVAGNPVRPEFFAPSAGGPAASDRARVLVFGGSQGAHAINVALAEAAPALAAAAPGVEVTHQTGERDLSMVRDAYAAAGLTARVEPFLYEMDREMRAADVIVCRAGATTLAELTAAGRAAILVPLPTATDDHQRRNADALVRQGAARVIDQRELTGARLAEELLGLARDGAARERMALAARGMARPDAARVIVDRVLALAGREGQT